MLTSVAAVTFIVAVPVTFVVGSVAVIVVVPTASAVAMPCDPAAFEIDATDVLDDDQVTVAVMSCVEPSLNVPVARNACVLPFETLGFGGLTSMPVSTALVTVSVVEPLTLVAGSSAVIVVVPVPMALATPLLPDTFEIVATEVTDELHVTAEVMSAVVPSL
jgi:hypothetical protein